MKYYSLLVFSIFGLLPSKIIAQKVESLGAAFNTEYNEIHPVIAPDGQNLYFVRVSHPSNNYGKDGSNDVWWSELLKDGRWSIARKMPNTINKDQYNDLFSITPDGNTALIRGVYTNGRKENEAGISICKKAGSGWSQPNKLEVPKLESMCKGQFLTAFLSNNGKVLLLAFSEKRNGKEDDIYVSLLDKAGKWSKPENLGNDINTGGSETTPFLASDNTTLYFASDRKGGEGGFDVWVAKRKGKGWNQMRKVVIFLVLLILSISSVAQAEKLTLDQSAVKVLVQKMYKIDPDEFEYATFGAKYKNGEEVVHGEHDPARQCRLLTEFLVKEAIIRKAGINQGSMTGGYFRYPGLGSEDLSPASRIDHTQTTHPYPCHPRR